MNRLITDNEKRLWEMLYRSQMALAEMSRDEMNRNAEEGEWPCGQTWTECNASSHAIFARVARCKAGIDHAEYLDILRSDDGIEIADPICEAMYERGPSALVKPDTSNNV